MANPTVRAIPLYYQNKKIAEAYNTEYTINANRQPLYGAEGLVAFSKGSVITGITVDFFVPVNGLSVTILEDLINQKDVTMRLPIGGKLYEREMALLSGSVKSSTETGRCEGNAVFQGGKPKLLG